MFLSASCLVTLKLIEYDRYKKSLKGEKLTNYIYHYVIKGKEYYYTPIQIENDNMYYISQEDNNELKLYSLYKRNIRDEKETKIGTFDGENSYCSFDIGNTILCSEKSNENYYDFRLNLIHSKPYEYNRNNMIQLVYYDGKFLKLDGRKLYDGDTLIKDIDLGADDAYNTNVAIFDGNTYLTFYSSEKKTYYYYDIRNDKFVSGSQGLYYKFNEGFYSVKSDEVISYNLVTGELKKYTDLVFNDKIFANALNNNILYYIENKKLHILDLENRIISRVEYEFDSDITIIRYDNGLVYLLSQYNDCDVFVIDVDKADKTTFTTEEYAKAMNDMVDNKVKEIEDKYHVDLVYKDQVDLKDDTFEATKMNNNYTILEALDIIEKVFSKFNTEFFDEFHDKDHEKGLVIYLTGKLIANDEADTTSNPAGYTLYRNDSYNIVADIESYALDSTICHELMHNIEHRIWDKFPYDEWYKNNPMYYEYMYTYRDDADFKFTLSEEDKNMVSFVDQYSKSWPTEDIARIFENICNKDEKTYLLDYPHLKAKALLLKETIEKYFPSLKQATVFNSLNEQN